jgi:mRNA-degrading endonuclease YafQ of YafQ-DinJ toxin-antitoxin module
MMLLVANDAPLDPEWLDDSLKEAWTDQPECHIWRQKTQSRISIYRNACPIPAV